eukprot:848572-Pleurochrysis_carterae.AAC.1
MTLYLFAISLVWKTRWFTGARPFDKVGGRPPQKAKVRAGGETLQRCYRAGGIKRGRGVERGSGGARRRRRRVRERSRGDGEYASCWQIS